ncbi:MAG: DUF2141 domain-containing protein [Flavobacteriaceae bacterium]|nr:DUF2141 domain-containing protein [Flavobacteriaceae bacterium]
MLKIIVVLLMYFISIVGFAQTSKTLDTKSDKESNYQINVIINNVTSDNGKVYFALYDSKNNFNNKKVLKVALAEIKNGKVNVTFSQLNPGTYAVTCFHDSNNNGKMDFQTNGMPIEDYGVSNNVMSYGPPQFDDAKFELTNKDLTFEIKL